MCRECESSAEQMDESLPKEQRDAAIAIGYIYRKWS